MKVTTTSIYRVQVWQSGKWITHPSAPEFPSFAEAERWAKLCCGQTRVVDQSRSVRIFTPVIEVAR